MTASLPDLQSLRGVERADVLKQGRRAASLTRTEDGVEFRYLREWVLRDGPAVATTLPVGPNPVTRPGGAVPAYFAGLLPEGRRLGALRREVKTSADDELSLLLAVGADAIGDVQVLPADTELQVIPPQVVIDDIGQMRFADLLADLGIRAQRAALPGVQDKTSAAMLNLPVTRAGERYILKLNPPEYRFLVENEAFFLEAARRSGLAVPSAHTAVDADGSVGLLVRRFDRITIDGGPAALAVEDGCQVCGRPPADKYVLGTERVFAALSKVCDARAVAARTLLMQLAFAYVTGNGDAHAKNFSVLQSSDGEWRPSPLYDVPSSQPYGDTTVAMSIGGRSGVDVTLTDLISLGICLGVPERATRRGIADLLGRLDSWLPDLHQLPFDVGRTRKLGKVIAYRRRLLSQ
ncbi:MAG: HipA domain-containing protein [Geodermatophilaceae bacterium]|jgi:serine/threonine-protein kinase HipA|nr:HipA domain-containing protein [Geodermatophilaceae bacterium]